MRAGIHQAFAHRRTELFVRLLQRFTTAGGRDPEGGRRRFRELQVMMFQQQLRVDGFFIGRTSEGIAQDTPQGCP